MRRGLACVSLALALAAGASATAPAATEIPRSHELAVFTTGQTAMSGPSEASRPLAWVSRRRPITEGATVLPVLASSRGRDGRRWLRVRLPGRPNNATGWIRAERTTRSSTPWHLVVDLSERRLTVYRRGAAVRSFPAIVGAASTPTPRGTSFVEETVLLRARDVGAPYALALASRSHVLQEFAGGPGQIAGHGMRNVGGVLGTAASHGCVRLATGAVTWVGQRIGPGVPRHRLRLGQISHSPSRWTSSPSA